MADHPSGGRNPRPNTPVGSRQSSSGSSSSSSQRGRGRKSFSHSPRGTFRGRSSGTNHFQYQVYRPKSKPIESQNVQNVNAFVSSFEIKDTRSDECGESSSFDGLAQPSDSQNVENVNAFVSSFENEDTRSDDCGESPSFDGLTQPIDSQNAENVNSLASKLEVEDNSRGGGGERLSVDGLSIGVSTQIEEKCGGDKEEREGCEGVVKESFDICVRKEGSGVVLKPSLFQRNKERRNEMKRASEGQKWSVLGPGMVILKNYLSMNDQIKIVNRCRELSLGAGGFYQPGYRDGGRLNLKMMCLGKNWDPDTSAYEDYRPYDNAKPPIIPPEFRELVEGSIKDAHSLIERTSKGSNVKEMLPSMSPNICIVNFYSLAGRLGLHQDKDESEESIRKGLPVVSFSIGDSAEFLYGDNRDVDMAKKVTLESGDVLIFGGKSRLIFHGVSFVQKETAPRSLLVETNLRPGRLNLTFRRY